MSAARHYSYEVYADPDTAKTFDQARFGGPIGSLISEDQERVVLGFLGEVAGRIVLDVGAGTGRAALALAKGGAQVIAVDASMEMLRVAARHAADRKLKITITPGDAHALPFADRSVDAVISLRLLMHTPDWRRCLSELCRVARQQLVIDYPALASAAALHAASRQVARRFGHRVEAYRVLGTATITRELRARGFKIVASHRQFVLPIAFHKLIGSQRFTRRAERLLSFLGFQRVLGSPVTVVAERCEF